MHVNWPFVFIFIHSLRILHSIYFCPANNVILINDPLESTNKKTIAVLCECIHVDWMKSDERRKVWMFSHISYVRRNNEIQQRLVKTSARVLVKTRNKLFNPNEIETASKSKCKRKQHTGTHVVKRRKRVDTVAVFKSNEERRIQCVTTFHITSQFSMCQISHVCCSFFVWCVVFCEFLNLNVTIAPYTQCGRDVCARAEHHAQVFERKNFSTVV